jgi:hypothetical protein
MGNKQGRCIELNTLLYLREKPFNLAPTQLDSAEFAFAVGTYS